MHWNSIKTLKLSPAPKPIFERSLLLHQDIFLQGYTSFVALWKKGQESYSPQAASYFLPTFAHAVAPMGQGQSQALPIFQCHQSYCFLRDIWCIAYKKGDFLPFLGYNYDKDVLICFPRYEAAMFTRVHWTTQPTKPSPSAARQPAERDLGAVARQSYKQCRCCAGGPSP